MDFPSGTADYWECRVPAQTTVATFTRIQAECEKKGWKLEGCVPAIIGTTSLGEIVLWFRRSFQSELRSHAFH